MNSNKPVSEYVRGIRKRLNLTQLEFARLIDSKRNNIAKYETGKAIPPGDVILRIQQIAK